MSGQYSGPKQPPEPGEPRTDPWGWLYRDDGPAEIRSGGEPTQPFPAPTHAASPVEYAPRHSEPPMYEPPVYEPPVYQSQSYAPDPGPAYQPQYQPQYPQQHSPQPNPAYVPPVPPEEPTPIGPEEPRRRSGLVAGLIVLALVLVVVIGLVLVNLSRSPSTSRPPATTAPAGSTGIGSPEASSAPPTGSTAPSTPSGQATYTGSVTPIKATGATAGCVAPDATDGNGDKVSYAAIQAIDGDLGTAWRCDGNGANQSLRIALPAGSKVARLGLVNGYTKTDPKTGDDRYAEYRRITKVRWELSNGASYEQTLKDRTETVQPLNIPVQEGIEWVQLTVLVSTTPGSTAPTRDAVLVSEVALSQPA